MNFFEQILAIAAFAAATIDCAPPTGYFGFEALEDPHIKYDVNYASQDSQAEPDWGLLLSLLTSTVEKQGNELVPKDEGKYAFKDQTGRKYDVEYARHIYKVSGEEAPPNPRIMFV